LKSGVGYNRQRRFACRKKKEPSALDENQQRGAPHQEGKGDSEIIVEGFKFKKQVQKKRGEVAKKSSSGPEKRNQSWEPETGVGMGTKKSEKP